MNQIVMCCVYGKSATPPNVISCWIDFDWSMIKTFVQPCHVVQALPCWLHQHSLTNKKSPAPSHVNVIVESYCEWLKKRGLNFKGKNNRSRGWFKANRLQWRIFNTFQWQPKIVNQNAIYQGPIVMPVETNWPILDDEWTRSGPHMLIEKENKN